MNNRLNIAYLGDGYSCNAIIESGFYEITNAANAPEDGASWLIVMMRSPRTSRGDVEAVQVAYGKATGAQWVRSSDGSVWTNWVEVGAGGGGTTSPADITVEPSTITALDSMITTMDGTFTYAAIAAALEPDVAADSLTAFLAVTNYVITNELWAKRLTLASPRIAQVVSNIGQPPDATYDRNDTKGMGVKWGTGDIAIDATVEPRHVYMCLDSLPNGAVWVQLYPAVTP